MKKTPRALFAFLLAAALPTWAEWELLRGNEDLRLSIDPQSVKSRDDDKAFQYLVDFRKPQGEPTGQYRSIIVGASLRCKDKAISLSSYQIFQGEGGKGVMLAMPEPSKEERGFRPIEKGSSDEELYQRVCLNKKAAPTAAKAEPAKKK
jgi:hypothetical protein